MSDHGNDINEYREISVLNAEHGVYVVQHIHSNTIALKKIMTVYDISVYTRLYEHPVKGVPRIYSLHEDNNTLTVIEEFISGVTLQDVLNRNGTMPEDKVLDHMIRLCEILSGLHNLYPPIIHRDIKPSNIIVTDDGRIVLIDLNAARTYKHGQGRDTRFLGTEGFAPPEQVGYGQTVPQTDIYAMGITMNVLLTGTLPSERMYRGALSPVIERCIKNDPENRYVSASVLRKQLIAVRKRLDKQGQGLKRFCIVSGAVIFSVILAFAAATGISYAVKRFRAKTDFSGIYFKDPHPTAMPLPDTLTGNKEAVLDVTKAVGVYTGNDLEVLVLDDTGMAYYYCINSEFTELECPWHQEGDRIIIDFARLHCRVYADVKDNDYSELILRSNSHNWNTEVFDKIALEPDDYIGRTIETNDKNATMNSDGTLLYVNQGVAFTIPKSFIDFDDEFDEMDNSSAFLEIDADNNYAAGLLFYGYDGWNKMENDKDKVKDQMEKFMGRFMHEVDVSDMSEITVAGFPAYTFNISGRYNRNFGPMSGREVRGRSAVILNESSKSELYVSALQIESRIYDISPVFEYMLGNAEYAEPE